MSGITPSERGGSVDRGGHTLTTGFIGQMKILRQQVMMPGETIRAHVQGDVKMEMLRERDSLRLNGHIAHFMTPIRWLWEDWPDYIKQGPNTSLTPPTVNTRPGNLGLGGDLETDILAWFQEAPLKVYNEWYKWPEEPDKVMGDFLDCVNLPHSWTRCRDNAEPTDDDDKLVGAPADSFNIQDLAMVQARYQSAMNREVFSFGRYQEILQDMWNQDGSREVDQVPVLIAQADTGVKPNNVHANDAAGLGQWAAIYDFKVDDNFVVTAPEHCIITSVLVVRFAPISEERNPLYSPRLSWAETVGDPYMLGVMPPQQVEVRDCLDTNATEPLGYLPAGWQWRARCNDIGERIDARDSFPYMKTPTNAGEARRSSLRTSAFRSSALQDYLVDMNFNFQSTNLIAPEMSSYTVGMERGSSKNPYIKVRKVR